LAVFVQGVPASVQGSGSCRLSTYILAKPTKRYAPFFAPVPDVLRRVLQPGDILLIEGNTRLSAIIKFLTQSTWSHAVLYVGERPGDALPDGEPNVLLEAEVDTGVGASPRRKSRRRWQGTPGTGGSSLTCRSFAPL
jgi:hypothetical protein